MSRFLYPMSVALLVAACNLGSDDDDDDDKDDGGGASDAWYEDFVGTYCARAVECYDDTTLEALGYEDEEDCRADLEAAAEDAGEDTGEECTFDAAAADVCLESMSGGDCDDFVGGEWGEDCEDLCE